MNNMKTFVMLAALTALIIFAGRMIGGVTGMTVALALAVVMNMVGYWFSDKIVLSMYRAKEISEAEAPGLYSMVRELARRAELPMPRVYIIPEHQPNAFATGRNPEHAAVAVTTGIMDILSNDELRGVIAHELAHVKNRDILIGTISAVLAGALTNLAHMALFFGGGRGGDDDEGGSPIVALVMMIVAPIAAMLIQMAISRSREYQADATGARICGSPRSLASALRRISGAAREIPLRDANPSTAHMFIVSPLSGGSIVSLFSTHPPMEKRVERLESMSL